MPPLWDKQGRQITGPEFAKLKMDASYWRIALDRLPDGRQVSTVWLGIDHSFGRGEMEIFETMVFAPGFDPIDCRRYATEVAATLGHAEVLAEQLGRPLTEDKH